MIEIKEQQIENIWTALYDVKDPEIPVISVVDLGIIVKIVMDDQSKATVTMTPTFTGCPAIDYMKEEIQAKVAGLDFVKEAEVIVDFSEAWTSDRISDKGRDQLKNFGLAPPAKHGGNVDMAAVSKVSCPNCGSADTTLNTPFGPTLCRSIHFCFNCKEGFEGFKPV